MIIDCLNLRYPRVPVRCIPTTTIERDRKDESLMYIVDVNATPA